VSTADPKLLVIDDEENIRFAMRSYFSASGFEVDVADGTGTARELLGKNCYAVVITDLRLGSHLEEDGLRIVREVHESSPSTGIIVLTAYGSLEVEQTARSRGADAFLSKPLPLAEIIQVARGLVAEKGQRLDGGLGVSPTDLPV